MHVSALIIQLSGAIFLLLYSTRMVRTGFERTMGPGLRPLLLSASNHAVFGTLTGIGVATLLQSSTAVVLLVAGFASAGALTMQGALAIILGADVGTALVVQFLSLDLSSLVPVLLIVGGIMFLRLKARSAKQAGRIVLGIAFILLSLQMISDATEPLQSAAYLPEIAAYLGEDVLAAFAGGALLAFLLHSSVAAILLLATFSAQGVIPLEAGLSLVLGANAGGAMVGVWLTRRGTREARRLTLANLLMRALLGLATLFLLSASELHLRLPGNGASQQLVNFHLLFNIALLFIGVLAIKPVLAITQLLTNTRKRINANSDTLLCTLDNNSLNNPERALASVTRELLRMSQLAESMMVHIPGLLERHQPEVVQQIKATEKQINHAHTAIKLYIADLNSGHLSRDEARRGIDLTSMAINIERVGDIIAKDLLERIEEKHEKRREFSPAGFREIIALHARVMENLQMALNVLLSEDLASAKQLVEEKNRIGALERETRARHLHRLMKGTPQSIATSDLHLEVVRALREINSLYTSVAYPILSKSGVLLDTRIAQATEPA